MSAQIFAQQSMSPNLLNVIRNTWLAFSAWNICLKLKIKVAMILNTEWLEGRKKNLAWSFNLFLKTRAEGWKEGVWLESGIRETERLNFTQGRWLPTSGRPGHSRGPALSCLSECLREQEGPKDPFHAIAEFWNSLSKAFYLASSFVSCLDLTNRTVSWQEVCQKLISSWGDFGGMKKLRCSFDGMWRQQLMIHRWKLSGQSQPTGSLTQLSHVGALLQGQLGPLNLSAHLCNSC